MNYTDQQDLLLLIDACRRAGEIGLNFCVADLKTELKAEAGNSPVTAADKAMDEFLKTTLMEARPDYGWLSEETIDDDVRLSRKRVWIVDPIDGTKGFLRWLGSGCQRGKDVPDNEVYAVSAALVEEGVPVVGVVYAPARDELFAAYQGGGVTLNGHAMTRPELAPGEKPLYLCASREYKKGLLAFLESNYRLRVTGSTAYKLACVAVGWGNVTAAMTPRSEWDIAAGDLLCREAGMTVTDNRGNPLIYNQPHVEGRGVIAGEPELHRDLLARFVSLRQGKQEIKKRP